MTREIKFRIWDKKNNCFFRNKYEAYEWELEELLINMNWDLMLREINQISHESIFPDRFIKLQYTWLLDKNGKEIYEGDILSNCCCNKKCDFHIQWKVIFNPRRGYQYIMIESEDWEGWFNLYYSEEFEVVWNIYENPELLSDTKV